jgi:hypothetical protein
MLIKSNFQWAIVFLVCLFLNTHAQADVPPSNWTLLSPTTSPPPLNSAAMAFDSANGQMILFGGFNFTTGAFLDRTWAYDNRNNRWIDKDPSSKPSARSGASMAFDSINGRIILFGGIDNTGLLHETWSYDAKTNTWEKLNLSNHPSAREEAVMAYDPTVGKMILFGGRGNGGALNDTWAFDVRVKDGKWEELKPNSAPSARSQAVMAFDSNLQKLILFGGTGGLLTFNDTWAFDAANNNWLERQPSISPPGRFAATMAFDPISKRVILFGGTNSIEDFSDTWGYIGNFNRWEKLNPPTSPPARESATMDYDSVIGRMILFGGFNAPTLTDLNDTWALLIGTAPKITSANTTSFIVGVQSSFAVTTTGFPTPIMGVAGVLPKGITFVDNGNGTATLSGTAEKETAGTYSLIFTAENGVAPKAEQNFKLEVNDPSIFDLMASTTTTLSVSSTTLEIGESTTLTARVDPAGVTGTVTFYDGTQVIDIVPLSQGTAILTTSFIQPESHSLAAVYTGNHDFLLSTSLPVTAEVVTEEVQPPRDVEGFQKVKRHRFKRNYINVITWQAPIISSSIVSYRIYRDQNLQKLIGEVFSDQPLRFKDRHRKPCKTYTYYIVSVDQFGNISEPAFVKIKGNKHCPFRR